MPSAFSWQNSVSLCPDSFCTLRPNLPVTPGISWLPTFAFQKSLSRVQLFVTLWTIQFMEFSRPTYWSGSLSLLQGIFPIQGLNPGLPHCRWILSQLSHKGSPRILEWVAYPFSSGYSWTRNQTRVSCIAGGFFTNWARRTFFSGVSSRRSCRYS